MREGLTVLIPVAATLAACGADERQPTEMLGRALHATSAAPGAQLVSRGMMRSSSRREGTRFTCRGRLDVRESTDLRCRNGKNSFRAIRIGLALYLNVARDPTPDGKPWVKVTVLDISWEGLALQYAADFEALAQVAGAGKLRKAGTERVRGMPTARYTATLDSDTASLLKPPHSVRSNGFSSTGPAGGDPLSVQFWIDENDLIRRTRITLRLDTYTDVAHAPPVREAIDYTTEYVDYTLQAPIKAPPARDTLTEP